MALRYVCAVCLFGIAFVWLVREWILLAPSVGEIVTLGTLCATYAYLFKRLNV